MKKKKFYTTTMIVVLLALQSIAFAHGGSKNVHLHVNSKWKECSLQLDPSLTQQAWNEFTKEAGMVAYFRPLADARPIGLGNYELSILQWATAFDDTKDAWNNTFVHPDSVHWLKESDRLGFPGLMFRAGISNSIDVGAYWTKNPEANYGFWGGQIQYNIMQETEHSWSASARASFVSLYGPDDLDLTVYGVDVLTSKKYSVYSDWISVSPYAGASVYLTASHEKTAAVNLHDETVAGVQGMIGAITHISMVKLAVEYNVAVVNTVSFKLGIGF